MTNNTTSKQVLINYRNYLRRIFPQSLGYILNNELYIKIPQSKIVRKLKFLNKHTNSQFKILCDLSTVDYYEKINRFEIIYILLSIKYNSRICISIFAHEKSIIKTVTNIFRGAGWFEREVWDMFGIFFVGNNDLRRILTDYGFKGHPLRKDFPLTGFTEVRYYFFEKRILLEETSLSQEMRIFVFDNPWGN